MKTPRSYRLARDRATSIVLAVVIGVIVGVGGWMLLHRQAEISTRTVSSLAASVASETAPQAPVTPDAPVAAARALQSHKALYDITLVSARNGSQVINVGGRMYFQQQRACEGWKSEHQFVLNYEYADTQPMRITSDFKTTESGDGQALTFSSFRRRDGELYQELRGTATLGSGGGSADYVKPAGLYFDLEPGTLLPTQHTARLLAAARAGQKFLSATVFDGTDDQGPVQISAVIGEKFNTLNMITPKGVDAKLLSLPAWRVRMAFFPLNAPGSEADYELSMVLHDNGVISDVTVDYADFSVHQSLTALAAVPAEPCPKPGKTAPDPRKRER